MKRGWVFLAAASLLPFASSAAVDEYAPPESQGISSKAIPKWIDACEKRLDDIHGFVLRRHGKVVNGNVVWKEIK